MKTLSKQLQTFFADKGCEFDSFRQLMMDTYSKELDGVSVKEANDKIRQIMFSLLELDEKMCVIQNCSADLYQNIKRNFLK